ncbi:anion permease [Natrialbaceae archaeon GCM10025810]|uniref:inorganic phosphate transporter n=1 Tax=Halovalidus salilacus TaxID=3075124 RepID=UPI0036106569
MSSVATLVLASLAGLSLSWALGASSTSPPLAPAVAANAVPVMRAAIFVGVFAFLGAVTQGGSVSATVGEGLIRGVDLTPLAAAVGLMTAAIFIAIGVFTGYPIPAAFATTGAVVGVGIGLGGDPAMGTYRQLATFWLLVPLLGVTISFTTAWLLRHDAIPTRIGVSSLAGIVGVLLANVSLTILPAPASGRPTIARSASAAVPLEAPSFVGSYDLLMTGTSLGLGVALFGLVYGMSRRSVDRAVGRFLLGLGALVTFSSGGSQVGLATGPMEPLVSGGDLPVSVGVVLFAGATGLFVGALTGAPRILNAVAREYADLGTRRSIAALVSAFVITQTGILLGFPISLNNIIISSVIGSGLVAGADNVSPRKIGFTAVAWVGALVSAFVVAYVGYATLSSVLAA